MIPTFLKEYRLIPLRPYSKLPLIEWGNDTIYNLDDYPNITGYAIDTGRSGLIVIDCDCKNDVDGVSAFLQYAEDNGGLPQTLTVETPNNGLHIYFKNTNKIKIKNSVSKLLKGVDIRADGGYVVGPNSVIKTNDDEEGTYLIEDEDNLQIAEIPDWLVEKLTGLELPEHETGKSKSKPKEESEPKTGSESMAEKRRALYWAQQKMSDATVGERNNILNKVSYFMGRKRVDYNESKILIQIATEVGLNQKEAETTFETSYQDGLKEKELYYDDLVKEYNLEMGKDVKQDPAETAYYTQVALSHNFAKAHPDEFIYWAEAEKWYQYNTDTGAWDNIPENIIHDLVDKHLDRLVNEIRSTITYLPANIYKLHEKLWSKSTIDAVTALCRNRFLTKGKDLFDKEPYLINCKNGIVNLKTGEINDHSPFNYVNHYIPVDYDPKAKDPYCDKIIQSIHPKERDYVQLMAGQSLTGYQSNYQAAIFFHGRGSNGKSTFIDLMLKTSGTYGQLQSPSIFLNEKNTSDKYALADFDGLRVAVVEELPNSKILDTSALKRLVGTQRINARQIYGSYREFENKSTIFVSCNKLPMVNESDEGTWRRVLVVSFPYSYKKSKEDVKGEFDRLGDPRVLHAAQRRSATAKAFLKWRIDGAMRWFKDANVEYKVPETITVRTEEWNANNDLILAWFKERIDASRDSFSSYITFDDLLRSYNSFLEQKGNKSVSFRFFSTEFTNHRVFFDNKLEYKKNTRILKDYTRSYNPDGLNIELKEKMNYILGVSFKG